MKIKTFAFILTTYYLLLTTGRVFAEDFSVGLSPQIITINAKTGESIKTVLDIENFSDSPATLSISLREFTNSKTDDNQIKLLPMTKEFLDFSRQIRITSDSQVIEKFIMPGKSKKKLDVSIDTPQDVKKRDFTFSILFTSDPVDDPESKTSRSRIRASIGANFLIRTQDTSSSTLKINKFSTAFFHERGPVPFKLILSNPNSHFISPSGTIRIRNMFGQMIGKIDLPPINILSNTSRTYFINTGYYPFLEDKAVWWTEKFIIGFYSAELIVTLPENDKVYSETIHFLALPYQGMIIIFIVIGLIFFIRKRFLYHINT